MIKPLFIDKTIIYDGTQLQPHWIYRNFDLLGDAIVAFVGEVRVELTEMVDIADVKEQAAIYSPKMLSFILEHFDTNLELAVFRQRMLMVAIKEELESRGIKVLRDGDDLYINDGKLSVSIATSSIVSTLIHVGLNIETEGTPVKTAGLGELGITDVKGFANRVMQRYTDELVGIYGARCKVRGISIDG